MSSSNMIFPSWLPFYLQPYWRQHCELSKCFGNIITTTIPLKTQDIAELRVDHEHVLLEQCI